MTLAHPYHVSAATSAIGEVLQHIELLAAASGEAIDAAIALRYLHEQGCDLLDLPGAGRTLARWQALAAVSAVDLSLAKLFEAHTDALAILAELTPASALPEGLWGVWAAEMPGATVTMRQVGNGVRLNGRKAWCSGADVLDGALLTVWSDEGVSFLAKVNLHQAGITRTADGWHPVGMSGVQSGEVLFDEVPAVLLGAAGAYLSRPGFWHGGAGIAACWYGAAAAIGDSLLMRDRTSLNAHQQAHLGCIDVLLTQARALLRETAAAIDRHPAADAQQLAMRVRSACEIAATQVIDHVGRAVGAGPYCRDGRFARRLADLPVFLRQSHAEKDLAALAGLLALERGVWTL